MSETTCNQWTPDGQYRCIRTDPLPHRHIYERPNAPGPDTAPCPWCGGHPDFNGPHGNGACAPYVSLAGSALPSMGGSAPTAEARLEFDIDAIRCALGLFRNTIRPDNRADMEEYRAAQIGLNNLVGELERQRKSAESAREYAVHLFAALAPQCEPLDDLLGVLTQIDNAIVGLRATLPPPGARP